MLKNNMVNYVRFSWCTHVVRDVRLVTYIVRDVRLDASDLVDVVLDQLGVVELHVPAHTQISDKGIFKEASSLCILS